MILRVVIKIKYSDKLICNGITSITSFVKAGQLFDTHTTDYGELSGLLLHFLQKRR